MDKINSLIRTIDNCSLRTQIIMLIAFIVFCILIRELIRIVFKILKNGITTDNVLSFFQELIDIIKELELKTIAGIINFLLAFGLLIITISVYISVPISGLLGFSENVSLNKLMLIFTTAFVTGISIWALYKFEKESKILRNGSA